MARNVGNAERVASMIGGVALAAYGLGRRPLHGGLGLLGGGLLSLLGGALVYRGATGRSRLYRKLGIRPAPPETPALTGVAREAVRVQRTITVDRPRDEIYAFWRALPNLPRFMGHLQSVTPWDDRRSLWVARAPAGLTVTWDAEITEDVRGERLAWRSVGPADVHHAGAVTFRDAPGGRGTEITVLIDYAPPGGTLGAAVGRLFGEEPAQQVDDDLRRLKWLLETGEHPTTLGQPVGEAARKVAA